MSARSEHRTTRGRPLEIPTRRWMLCTRTTARHHAGHSWMRTWFALPAITTPRFSRRFEPSLRTSHGPTRGNDRCSLGVRTNRPRDRGQSRARRRMTLNSARKVGHGDHQLARKQQPSGLRLIAKVFTLGPKISPYRCTTGIPLIDVTRRSEMTPTGVGRVRCKRCDRLL